MRSVVLLAAISLALYVMLARLAPGNGWRDTSVFLLLMAGLFTAYAVGFRNAGRLHGRGALLAIAACALLFRLALLPAGLPRDTPIASLLPLLASDVAGREVVFEPRLLYDDDHWRYLWDGHVAANGLNPFALAPQDPRLDALAPAPGLWEEIRGQVNHPSLTTIYPPLTQLAFRTLHAIAPGSIVVMKLAWIVADLGVMLLLGKTLTRLGRPPSQLLLYAWNPLLIKSTAGSAHFDILVALAVALLMYGVVSARRFAIAAGFAAAVAVKVTPAVFLLPVLRRLGVARTAVAGVITALLLAPMGAGGSGSEAFARDWEFNATFFHALEALFWWSGHAGWWARATVAVAVAFAAWWASRRFDRGRPADPAADLDAFADAALLPMALLLVCGPVLMPWYLVWVLPLAAGTRRLFWFQLTAVVQLAFFVMVDGRERPVVLCLEAVLMLFLLRAWLTECRSTPKGATP